MYIKNSGKRTKKHLELAKQMALQSSYGKFQHGAVLVRGNRVINASFNKDRFNSFGTRFRERSCGHATHHAELGCIVGLDRSITSGATIYVVRINAEGKFRMSKPCKMCHELLKHCGVKKVVYTINEKEIASYRL